jgi:hypothetical protein
MNNTAALRLVFIGDVDGIWKSSAQRLAALRSIGVDVVGVIDYAGLPALSRLESHAARLLGQPAFPWNLSLFNREILARAAAFPVPDVVWIEWPRWIYPETLRALRALWHGVKLVCFQDDNPFGYRREAANWQLFKRCIPEFDLHLVKRDEDLVNFRAAGALRVEKFLGGYSAALLAASEGGIELDRDVTFIGTAMDGRPEWFLRLREESGISVHVHGGKWKKSRYGGAHPGLVHPHANGADYVRAIARSRICLGLVSHTNRDGYSMRSFEIPALGGFLLAERTPEHLALYREGEEAEFFGDLAECAAKIRRYLGDEPARIQISTAGQRKCLAAYPLEKSVQLALEMLT